MHFLGLRPARDHVLSAGGGRPAPPRPRALALSARLFLRHPVFFVFVFKRKMYRKGRKGHVGRSSRPTLSIRPAVCTAPSGQTRSPRPRPRPAATKGGLSSNRVTRGSWPWLFCPPRTNRTGKPSQVWESEARSRLSASSSAPLPGAREPLAPRPTLLLCSGPGGTSRPTPPPPPHQGSKPRTPEARTLSAAEPPALPGPGPALPGARALEKGPGPRGKSDVGEVTAAGARLWSQHRFCETVTGY